MHHHASSPSTFHSPEHCLKMCSNGSSGAIKHCVNDSIAVPLSPKSHVVSSKPSLRLLHLRLDTASTNYFCDRETQTILKVYLGPKYKDPIEYTVCFCYIV